MPPSIRPLLTCAALLSVALHAPLSSQVPADSLTLPKVLLRTVTPSGETIAVLGPGITSVDTATAVVPEGANAKSLLATRQVYADAGAFAWLLSVNPSLRNADSLRAGDSIRLPKFQPGTPATEAVTRGQFIAFTLEPALRDSVRVTIDEATRSVASLGRTAQSTQFFQASRTVRSINLGSSGASTQALRWVRQSAGELNELAIQHRAATPAERTELSAQAGALAVQLSEVEAQVEGGSAPVIMVTVDVLYEDTGTPTEQGAGYVLRWATRGDRASCAAANCGSRFQTHYPKPSTRLNLNGKYMIWAVRNNLVVSCDEAVDPVSGGSERYEVRVFRKPPPPQGSCK